jgi:hypothetical protein
MTNSWPSLRIFCITADITLILILYSIKSLPQLYTIINSHVDLPLTKKHRQREKLITLQTISSKFYKTKSENDALKIFEICLVLIRSKVK